MRCDCLPATQAKEIKLDQSLEEWQSARQLLDGILACRATVSRVLEQIALAQSAKGDGSDDEHYTLLTTALKTADDEFRGLPEATEIKTARDTKSHIEQETVLFTRLKAAVPKGQWHNTTGTGGSGGGGEPIESGRYDQYQSAATIDIRDLWDSVQESKRFGMKTKDGRMWSAIAELCVRLRSALIGWLKQPLGDPSLWRKVEELVPGTGDGVAPEATALYNVNDKIEIAAVKREIEYRVKVAAANAALVTACAPPRDESAIDTCLKACDALYMMPGDHEPVRTGRALLARITECKNAMSDALVVVRIEGLIAAVADVDSFQYQTAQVDRCRRFIALLTELNTACRAFAQSKIESVLTACEAQELGMNQSCTALVAARALVAKIIACRQQARRAVDETVKAQSVDESDDTGGSTELHTLALRTVRELAHTELGGLHGVAELDAVTQTLERLDKESQLVIPLRNCLSAGGWLNVSVTAGDYDQYQDSKSVDTTKIDDAIQVATKFECRTRDGRQLLKSARVILSLRQRVVEAVGPAQDLTKWAAVDAVLSEAKRVLSPQQLSASMEISAARAEYAYQIEVGRANDALAVAITAADQDALATHLASADHLHMRVKFNPRVEQARTLLARIVAVRKHMQTAMDEVDHTQLVAACKEAESIPAGSGSYHTSEVVLCEQFRDTVANLKTATANFALKDIEAGLEKVCFVLFFSALVCSID